MQLIWTVDCYGMGLSVSGLKKVGELQIKYLQTRVEPCIYNLVAQLARACEKQVVGSNPTQIMYH